MCAAEAIESRGLTKNRVEALADGVFATLMTVLVLTLALPAKTADTQTIALRLWALRDSVFVYALSFIQLGVFWVGHHNMFHSIRKTTRIFLWLNILFLLSVGVIPFTTTVFGTALLDPTAIIVYGVNLMLAGTMLYVIWWYATRGRELVDRDIDEHMISSVKRRILTGPLFSLSSIAFAYVLPILSLVFFVSALIFFILPGHVDIHFTRKHD